MSADRASTEAAAPERDPRADVVIAATACLATEDVLHAAAAVREALVDGASGRRVVLIHADTADATQIEPVDGLTLVPAPLAPAGPLPFGAADPPEVLHALSAAAADASARAAVLVGSAAEGITADTVATLAAPVLDHGIDLVCPIYPRHHLDGLINRGIVVPLTGALYGQRVDGQLGLDFAFSPACLAALAPGRTATARPLWPVTRAIALGMRVAQARLARWAPIDVPVADASAALLAVLGSLFADVEANATIWQRLRGSRPVPVFGASLPHVDEPRAIDVGGLIESFEIGRQNLQDVWGRLMPPATLMELNRVSRHPGQDFRLPDRLWARIVFDFALGYRLRTINRDHVLRAMTPLYLAWTASFVSELQSAGAADAERRSEQLAAAYEAEKPYLVARWRWPDRFNP